MNEKLMILPDMDCFECQYLEECQNCGEVAYAFRNGHWYCYSCLKGFFLSHKKKNEGEVGNTNAL